MRLRRLLAGTELAPIVRVHSHRQDADVPAAGAPGP